MVTAAGWLRIGPEPQILAWATAAQRVAARVLATSPEPWRCGGTWFVGVDALPNRPDGSLNGVAFPWGALPLTPEPLHPGQLSVLRPGYPRPGPKETAAAFKFRQNRDAAHLDGVLPVGPARQRMVREPHRWVLGLPLTACTDGPLVVWQGSHLVMQARLRAALAGHPPAQWGDVDLTDAYAAARAEVFATCRRIELPSLRGEATLLHRLTLHGMAPWPDTNARPTDLRMIAYFRPQLSSVQDWIALP